MDFSFIEILDKNKNTQFYIIGCKIGCTFCKSLIINVYCGETGTPLYIMFSL